MNLRTATAALLLLVITGTEIRAGERTEESFIPNYAVAGSYFTWSGDSDFDGRPGSLSQRESGVELNAPVVMRDGFRLTAGVKYRRNHLDFAGAPAPFGNRDFDLHRLDLPLNVWKDFNNRRWKLWLRLQPGWYSDFETVNSDDFILTSLALFSYQWSDSLKIAFGAFYSRDLGEERILPALGFIYEPDPHWSLALTFPRVELAHAPNDGWLFTGRAVLGGAGWNITDPAGGPADADLNYRSIRLGLGVDRKITRSLWLYADAGALVGQELELVGGAAPFQADLGTSFYATAGIRLRP